MLYAAYLSALYFGYLTSANLLEANHMLSRKAAFDCSLRSFLKQEIHVLIFMYLGRTAMVTIRIGKIVFCSVRWKLLFAAISTTNTCFVFLLLLFTFTAIRLTPGTLTKVSAAKIKKKPRYLPFSLLPCRACISIQQYANCFSSL